MSYQAFHALLQSAFFDLNATNAVPAPQQVWDTYRSEIDKLFGTPELRHEFTELHGSVRLPKTLEAVRMLQSLRRRFNRGQDGLPLVERIRAEVVLRRQPERNVARGGLAGEARAVAEVAPEGFATFSQFQVDGWSKAIRAVDTGGDMVIVAPTGGGKTEVFLLPLIQRIAQALREGRRDVPRFIFVQELLGHANIGITLDTYSHVLPGMGDGLADAMDDALG